MKITSLQNTRSFKGLNIEKVSISDIKRVILPCAKKLNEFSKKADISLESSSVMHTFEHFKSPAPAIRISIKPLHGLNAKIATSNYLMDINKENIKKKTLLQIIKNAIMLI